MKISGHHEPREPSRECVANQNGIIARRIQPAVDGVMQRGTDQGMAALQRQGAVHDEVAFVGRLHGSRSGRPKRRCDCSYQTLIFVCLSYFALRAVAAAIEPANFCPFAVSIAWSKSANMSRMSSMPTESLTSSGLTPVAACSSAESC